jgi:IS605 OrfB family transposase
MYNAVSNDVRGDIESRKELLKRQITEKENDVKAIEKTIKSKKAKIKKIKKDTDIPARQKTRRVKGLLFVIHQKKRKLHRIKARLEQLQEDKSKGKIRLCFGSKELFRKQFEFKKNGYASFEKWKEDWRNSRNSAFFFIGSKDEKNGNQLCKLIKNEDGFHACIRVPDTLVSKYGKYLYVPDVSFAYGEPELAQAVENGQALSHRFIRGKRGWYLHTSFFHYTPEKETRAPRDCGCIGVDINEKQVAVCEVDRFGNPVYFTTYSLNVRDRSEEQTKALVGDVVKNIVERAKAKNKPIVHEKLDFGKKRSQMKEQGTKYSRMLSGFVYSLFLSFLVRSGGKNGIKTYGINPAFTSLIGQYKFMGRFGVSSHEAAACVIARRCQRYCERIPTGAAFTLSVRNRVKHVWSYWNALSRRRGKIHDLYNLASLTGNRRWQKPTSASSGIGCVQTCGAR